MVIYLFFLTFPSKFRQLLNSYSIPGTEDNKNDNIESLSSVNCVISLGDRLLMTTYSREVHKVLETQGKWY